MKKLLILAIVLSLLLIGAPVEADPGILYVDATGSCGGNSPCYLHPQDAVNAANPGDTILVYPGTYDSRFFQCPWAPNCSCSDNYSPALIVYKDGLTIKSVEGPTNTVIQATHTCWSNAIAVENSTNHGLNGISGWNPSAVTIVANNVTIEGFTFRRPSNCSNTYNCFWNTAGVFIGSKGGGYPDFLGHANGATVKNNVFRNVWHAVYIWHSRDNTIVNNTVEALGDTGHWAAISSYDGWNDASISLGNLSENNLIAHNTIADKGIALGAWAPSTTWTSNAGSQVCANTTTQVGVTYAHGPVIIACNTGGFWQTNTDNVLRITGVAYTGDTALWGSGPVPANLSAQVVYDGSADGSGIQVVFTVGNTDYPATTVAGGLASATASLAPGNYTVEAKVAVCDDCEFTDSDVLVVGQVVAIDIKPGSYPNSINLKSKGVVPVAVLTTAEFAAGAVDPATVRFAGAAPERWAMKEVDGDGDADLLFHFRTQDLNLTSSSTEATLTGTTTGGTPIKGTDTVNIVPK
jgi:parallel beta-helix repeat protein